MPVYKYGKNKWYVKYHNKTKRGFFTKSEALLYEARLIAKNEEPISFKKLHAIAHEYLNYREKNVLYSTYQKTANAINKFIIPNTKNIFMHKISEFDCQKFMDYVREINCSTTHKNYIISQYISLFKFCNKFYRTNFNQYDVIEKFKKTTEELIKKKDREMNIWTVDEFSLFIKNVNRTTYKEFFTLLYFTGLRLGEALALTWDDFKKGKLIIKKSLTRKTNKGYYEIKSPKSLSSIRNIELGDNLNKSLLDYKHNEQKIAGFNENWFIFGRIKPLSQVMIDRVKNKAIRESNLRYIRIHDFRHCHASNLIADNVNIVAVSKRLGHSDISITLKVYTHLIQKNNDELRKVLDCSNKNFFK